MGRVSTHDDALLWAQHVDLSEKLARVDALREQRTAQQQQREAEALRLRAQKQMEAKRFMQQLQAVTPEDAEGTDFAM